MTKIFMNSENTSPHSLVVNVTDKMDLIREDAHVALPSLSIYYTWKKYKSNVKAIHSSYQDQHGLKNSSCLMGRFLYQLFKIIRIISSKSRRQWQTIYQQKYANTSAELIIVLHLRLRLDIILDFPPLERLNC